MISPELKRLLTKSVIYDTNLEGEKYEMDDEERFNQIKYIILNEKIISPELKHLLTNDENMQKIDYDTRLDMLRNLLLYP